MQNTIDPSWVELQTGLYLEEQTMIINGTEYTFRYLHSSDGYCFYDLTDEIREDGTRMYYQFMGLAISYSSWTYEQLNAQFISVPVEEGFEIASVSNYATN